MMSWELFSKVIRDLNDFQGLVKAIDLFGMGEPLLNPRIADMICSLKNLKGSPEVRIITNASLLNETMSRKLIDAGLDRITISVEGLSDEAYQKFCGVNIEFNNIVKNVEAFYKLSRGTAARIAVKVISASLDGKTGVQDFYRIFSPISDYHSIEEIQETWPEFEAIKPGVSEDNEYEYVTSNARCYQPGTSRGGICSFPFTDMIIRANGAVCACCVDWKFATQYGDVNQERLTEIWNGKKHIEFQLAHLNGSIPKDSFCGGCRRLPPDKIEDPGIMAERLRQLIK